MLDHKAECDGYSDAFYLLCSLAGIKVGLQYGYIENGTHQWNTVMINGSWYFTDVTWDDVDYSSNKKMATYRYYHVGGNFLETHQWCADFSPCSVNPYMPWDEFPYTGKKKSGLDLGVYAGDVDSMCAWLASWRREGKKQCHVMIDGRYEYQSLINAYEKYCKKKKIRCGSFYLWANPMGNYTCVDVCFK